MFKNDEEVWVEVSDAEGHTAALRHLATVHDGGRIYHILAAYEPKEDGNGGLLLVREDTTADGAEEYVLASDEKEIERVIGGFIARAMALLNAFAESDEDEDEPCPACGERHAPGEFCYCDDPDMLQ